MFSPFPFLRNYVILEVGKRSTTFRASKIDFGIYFFGSCKPYYSSLADDDYDHDDVDDDGDDADDDDGDGDDVYS